MSAGPSLADIATGNKFRIRKVNATGEVRRRLIDIGFIKNEEGAVLREALLKDPIEVVIKGTHVSLRRCEAKLIDIEEIS